MSTPPTQHDDEVIAQLAKQMNDLEERVDTLESENSQLNEENDKLRSAVASLEENNRALRGTIDELTETIEDLEQEKMVLEQRLDRICDDLDEVEEDVKETRQQSERKHADVAHRLAKLEDTLDLDVVEVSTTSNGNGTVIEQFASLPEEVKEEQLTQSMQRATVVFEQFMDWGDFTQKGYLIKSSELRKLLSTVYEDDFQWSQVYRVMEAFDKGTPPEFEYKETKRHGKVLIKYHDVSEARAEATNTVVSGD